MTPIEAKTAVLGSGHALGAPTGPEEPCPDGVGARRMFEHGAIYWHPQSGAHEVHGPIAALWQAMGAEAGALGYPVSDELGARDGVWRFGLFREGAIHWSAATGAIAVPAAAGVELALAAIPQVDAERRGIHLVWSGVPAWLYSPYGFWLQRRPLPKTPQKTVCVTIAAAERAQLASAGELATAAGVVTLETQTGPASLVDGAEELAGPWQVYTLELAQPRAWVSVKVEGKLDPTVGLPPPHVWAIPIAGGRAIGPAQTALVHVHEAQGIERIVMYTRFADAITVCVRQHEAAAATAGWRDVPFLAKGLQLPLDELLAQQHHDPSVPLVGAYAETQRRLVAGEGFPEAHLARVTPALAAAATRASQPRPCDQLLQTRGVAGGGAPGHDETQLAIGPIAALAASPTWRRALGLAYFDGAPELVDGAAYEYRLTAYYPAEDLAPARTYAFSTVPTGTRLPLEYYLDDLRVVAAAPLGVELVDVGTAAAPCLRRGVALKPRAPGAWPWLVDADLLGGTALVLELPRPAAAIVLELAPGHALSWAADDPLGASTPWAAIPAGGRARLEPAAPMRRIRIQGTGTLLAVRVPAAASAAWVPVSAVAHATLVDAPRVPAPLAMTPVGLQQPFVEPTTATPVERPAPKPLGFRVAWVPAPSGGSAMWPPGAGAPPHDAAGFQIEHRAAPAGAWVPLRSGANLTFGMRAGAPPETSVRHGVDLLALYPLSRPPAPGAALEILDVFDDPAGGHDPDAVPRPLPALGTLHRYRIRAVDVIGRPGAGWCESAAVRLEKHAPPPVPVGVDAALPPPAASEPEAPHVTGVTARLFVRGSDDFAELLADPRLTAAELARAGTARDAIVLAWGWHAQQRALDPYAREFRVYTAPPLDEVAGTIKVVETVAPGRYRCTATLARAIDAGAAEGVYVATPYPMRVGAHAGGDTVVLELTCKVPRADGTYAVPAPGAFTLPLRWTPGATRPVAWQSRAARIPITAQTTYHHVFFDTLDLSDDHPRDRVWVGVSTADDQPYVADSRGEGAAGNESAVEAVPCAGTYARRPVLAFTPVLADVAVLVTPEPGGAVGGAPGAAVACTIDLAPGLAGVSALGAGARVRPERATEADVVRAYRYDAATEVLYARTPKHETSEPLEAPAAFFAALAPADRDAIAAAYTTSADLPHRHLVYLAGAHPYAHRLFEPAVDAPIASGPFAQTLRADARRYVYRVRLAGGGGRLSDGAVVAALVVRIPDMSAAAVPEYERIERPPGGGITLVLRAAPERALTDLLVFASPVDAADPPPGPAHLARLPERRDRPIAERLRLWARGGLIAPIAKSLAAPDVRTGDDNFRYASIAVPAAPGATVLLWACAATEDGAPSPLIGPFRATARGEV